MAIRAYYNEFEPYAAQWLRNLIAAGLIAPGDVDERSIEDVRPEDLRDYNQCHFFAGIGVWSHALRQAGWDDSRSVWSGSCPCQPFSTAGKAGGFDDERHLWPAFHHLISECRPDVVFGEQVASKDGLAWLDLVFSDLEGTNYTCGALDLCAAGVGAPHIRQRLYWVGSNMADASSLRRDGRRAAETSPLQGYGTERGGEYTRPELSGQLSRGPEGLRGDGIGVADTSCQRRQQDSGSPLGNEAADGGARWNGGQPYSNHESAGHGQVCGVGLGDTPSQRLEGHAGNVDNGRRSGRLDEAADRPTSTPGCTNGFWRDADWLPFRDSKIRPVEPGTFPLVDGTPSTVGRLRAYGNAIVAPLATEFIKAFMEVADGYRP